MPRIAVPEDLRKTTTVHETADGTMYIQCKPGGDHHAQAAFISGLLGPDRKVFLGGGEFGNRTFVLTEALGNMNWYAWPKSNQQMTITITPDLHCVARTSGYITPEQRERMGIKFQVAASLTREEARNRLERWAEGDYAEEPDYARHDFESGGMGILAHRAYSEGEMALTFFPDDTRKTRSGQTLQRFEYSIELTLGRNKPSPTVADPRHQGVVFPQIVRGLNP